MADTWVMYTCTVDFTDLVILGLVYGGHKGHICTAGFIDLMILGPVHGGHVGHVYMYCRLH